MNNDHNDYHNKLNNQVYSYIKVNQQQLNVNKSLIPTLTILLF